MTVSGQSIFLTRCVDIFKLDLWKRSSFLMSGRISCTGSVIRVNKEQALRRGSHLQGNVTHFSNPFFFVIICCTRLNLVGRGIRGNGRKGFTSRSKLFSRRSIKRSLVGLTECLMKCERTEDPVKVTRILSELTRSLCGLLEQAHWLPKDLINLNGIPVFPVRFLNSSSYLTGHRVNPDLFSVRPISPRAVLRKDKTKNASSRFVARSERTNGNRRTDK